VIAGTCRGRRLVAPDGPSTRPTSDRVRESIFNSLSSMDAVVDAVVWDLFAGSGALGIEALSRGARHVTFVEDQAPAIRAITANLRSCGFEDRATVVRADARSWSGGVGPAGAGRSGAPPDLVLADPPYSFQEWPQLLDRLPACLLVAESTAPLDLGPRWRLVRERAYGTTVVVFAAPAVPQEALPT